MNCDRMIRLLRSYYFKKNIRSYLQFSGAVEIDETKVGSMFFKLEGEDFKWVFGFCDRKTRITLMYYVPVRTKALLHKIIK